MQVLRGEQAFAVWLEIGDLYAALFQRFGRVQDGVVLDGAGDEVSGLAAVEKGLQKAREREVVTLCTAGGEDDLLGRAVQEPGDRCPGTFHCGASGLAALVRGAWVAEALGEEGRHRGEDFRQHGRSRVRVEVDALHVGRVRRKH